MNEADTIWDRSIQLDELNALAGKNMASHLDIRFTEVGDDFLVATMPVDERTMQPFGLLHGGASVVLAETLGSAAGVCTLDPEEKRCVGIEINANHVRSVREGTVTGRATPEHLGGRTQVWSIRIVDEEERLVSICRLTMAVIDAP